MRFSLTSICIIATSIIFLFQIEQLRRGSQFEDEIRREKERKQREEEERERRRLEFKEKAAMFQNGGPRMVAVNNNNN